MRNMNPHFITAAKASTSRVLQSIGIIISSAARYTHLPSHVTFEDLVQEGIVGLLEEEYKFDPDRGEWGGFVVFVVRKAIRESLLRSQTVRLPRALVSQIRKVRLLAEKGWTAEDIAKNLSLPVDACQAAIDQMSPQGELTEEPRTGGVQEDSLELHRVVKRISELTQEQRRIITGRAQGYTLGELGKLMLLSTQVVSYQYSAGLKKLIHLREGLQEQAQVTEGQLGRGTTSSSGNSIDISGLPWESLP